MNKCRLAKTVFAHAAMWPAVQIFDDRNVREDRVSRKSNFYWTEPTDPSNFGEGQRLFYNLLHELQKTKSKDSM